MNGKHTPGEMKFDSEHGQLSLESSGRGNYVSGTRVAVALVRSWDSEPPEDEVKANAERMVTAWNAHDGFKAAVEALMRANGDLCPVCDHYRTHGDGCVVAAAIAAARGV